MLRLSKVMLNQLPNGKYLKLEDLFLYGILSLKANYSETHTIEYVSLDWFCICMGEERTDKRRRVIRDRMEKLEQLGLIKITRDRIRENDHWVPLKYEVIYPDRDYELINTEFMFRKDLSPAAKGLALALSVFAYRGTNHIGYTDKDLCERIHITHPTYKKYIKELEQAEIIKDKTLSTKYFPIIITNNILRSRLGELRMFEGKYFHNLLDWFEETFLSLPPSTKLNDLGLKVLHDIEWGKFKREKVEEQLREFHPIILD